MSARQSTHQVAKKLTTTGWREEQGRGPVLSHPQAGREQQQQGPRRTLGRPNDRSLIARHRPWGGVRCRPGRGASSCSGRRCLQPLRRGSSGHTLAPGRLHDRRRPTLTKGHESVLAAGIVTIGDPARDDRTPQAAHGNPATGLSAATGASSKTWSAPTTVAASEASLSISGVIYPRLTVLRVLRCHGLLSPPRRRQHSGRPSTGPPFRAGDITPRRGTCSRSDDVGSNRKERQCRHRWCRQASAERSRAARRYGKRTPTNGWSG